MPEIEMIQQMSGRRADGRFWPPVGGVIEVSAAEARELCATQSQQSHPIAKYVSREEETGDAPGGEEKASDPRKAEDALQKAPKAARPDARPARPGVEKRG